MAESRFSVEQVLLAAGEHVGHRLNISHLIWLPDEQGHGVICPGGASGSPAGEKGLVLEDQFILITPLYLAATRVTMSTVPPFIPNELLEN